MSCGSSDSWHCQDPSINLNPFDAPDPAEIKIVFRSEHRPHERFDSSFNAYHGLQEVFFALQVVLGMPRGTKTYWHDEHAKLFLSRRAGGGLPPRQSYPRDNQMLEVIHKIFDAHGVIVSGPGGFGVGGPVAACKDCAEVRGPLGNSYLSFDASVQLFRAAAFAHCRLIDYDNLVFDAALPQHAVAGGYRDIALVQRGEKGAVSRYVELVLSAEERANLPPITEHTMNTREGHFCDTVQHWATPPARYIVAAHGANMVNVLLLGHTTKCVIEVFPIGYYTPCFLIKGQTQPRRWVQVMGDRVCNTSLREHWHRTDSCGGNVGCCNFDNTFDQSCSFWPELWAMGIGGKTANYTSQCRDTTRGRLSIELSYEALKKALAVCDS